MSKDHADFCTTRKVIASKMICQCRFLIYSVQIHVNFNTYELPDCCSLNVWLVCFTKSSSYQNSVKPMLTNSYMIMSSSYSPLYCGKIISTFRIDHYLRKCQNKILSIQEELKLSERQLIILKWDSCKVSGSHDWYQHKKQSYLISRQGWHIWYQRK